MATNEYGPFRDVTTDGAPNANAGIWDKLVSMVFDCDWTVSAEAGSVITVTAQLKDLRGRNLARHATCIVTLHDSVDAGTTNYGAIAADDGTTELAVTSSKGLILAEVAGDSGAIMQTDSDGLLSIEIDESDNAEAYKLQLAVGDRVFQSPVLVF
jgi:hypothetical protein